MSVMKVVVAMGGVQAELAKVGIGKSKHNKQQDFKYRGIDQVLNVLSAIFAENKLIVIPKYTDRVQIERVAASGKPIFWTVLNGTYTLVSTEDGSSIEAGPFPGEAMDSADKATNKAMSVSFKYFALNTFIIPVEGTPDADAEHHELAPSVPPPPVDVNEWIEKFAACTTRDEIVAARKLMRIACAKDPEAVKILIAANDARGKVIGAAALREAKATQERVAA